LKGIFFLFEIENCYPLLRDCYRIRILLRFFYVIQKCPRNARNSSKHCTCAGFWGMFHKASYQRNWLKYYILFFAGSTKKFLFLKNNCYKLLNFEVRFLLKKSKQFIQNCYESSPYFINNSKNLYIKRSNLACSTY